MIMAMMVALQVKMTRMRVTIIKRIKNYRVRAAVTKCGCPRAALRSNCGGGQFEGGVFSFGESEGGGGGGGDGGGVFRAVTDSGGHYTSRRTPVLPPTAMPARTSKLSKKL